MNDIEKHLKEPVEQDLHINDYERKLLIDVLAFVSGALKNGQLWFNDKNDEMAQRRYAEFCDMMARRFANMPVHQIS